MADPVLQSPKNPHFFQPLLPGFETHLNIPITFFSKYFLGGNKYKNGSAKLRSDASNMTWEVTVDDSRTLTGEGWREFVTAHNLRIGDVLVFRQEGDLVFHVTALGPSCCEIQYVQNNNISQEENIKTEPECFSSDESCFIAGVTDSNLEKDTLFLPGKFTRFKGLNEGSDTISLMNEVRTWTLILTFSESSRVFYIKTGWRSFCHENGFEPGDSITFTLETDNTQTPLLRFSASEPKSEFTNYSGKWKRRSDDSSQSSSLNENRFVKITVTPATLHRRELYLRYSFTKVNKLQTAGGKKIMMLDKHGVEWPVILRMGRNKRYMCLSSGTKEFIKANGFKLNESFLLELVWEDKTRPPMFKFYSMVKT